MSLSLNFLVDLKALCEKEISKRGQNRHETGEKKVLSVLSTLNTYGANKTPLTGNHSQRLDKSSQISSLPKEKDKKNSEKEEDSKISKAKTYFCAKCGYSSKCLSDYIKHKESGEHIQPIQCRLCSDKCLATEFDDHLKSVHMNPNIVKMGEDGSFICIKCNISCKYFSKFKLHLFTLSHQGLELCKSCNLALPLEEMKVHRQEVHGKQGDVYVCKICGYHFPCKESLDRHVTSLHTKERKLKCSECGAMFKRGDALKKHLQTHSNLRSHCCPVCKLLFKAKDTLDEHIRNIHHKNRYQCKECYRGFSDENDLDNHVLTHQNFVFQCMVCGKGFRTYQRREVHFKSHLNAPKQRKTQKRVAEYESDPSELSESDSKMPLQTETRISQISKSTARDFAFPSRSKKPVDGADSLKYEKSISDSKCNLGDVNAISLTRRERVITGINTQKKSVNLDGRKKPGHCKSVTNEVASLETNKSCYNSTNFEKGSNLETPQSDASKLFGSEKWGTSDSSLSGKTTSKTAELVYNLLKNGSYGFGMVGTDEENHLFLCSTDGSVSEKVISPPVSSFPVPEETLFVDINNLSGINSDNTLFIDTDNICKVENIDVIEVGGLEPFPIEVQFCDVKPESWNVIQDIQFETDCAVSAYSTDLAHQIKMETDSGVSLCNDTSQDEPPVKKVPAKKKMSKISHQQKSKRTTKSSKYSLPEKKVIMRNIITDDDVFVLPEFVIDEDD